LFEKPSVYYFSELTIIKGFKKRFIVYFIGGGEDVA